MCVCSCAYVRACVFWDDDDDDDDDDSWFSAIFVHMIS